MKLKSFEKHTASFINNKFPPYDLNVLKINCGHRSASSEAGEDGGVLIGSVIRRAT